MTIAERGETIVSQMARGLKTENTQGRGGTRTIFRNHWIMTRVSGLRLFSFLSLARVFPDTCVFPPDRSARKAFPCFLCLAALATTL